MKIVYCIGGTHNSGGMERVLANKANWLVRHGYQVTIVTTEQRGRKPFFALDHNIRQVDLGINYGSDTPQPFWKKLLAYPKKLRQHKKTLSRLLLDLRPDIVVSLFDNGSSVIPKINDGSKKILEVHFSRYKRLQYGRGGFAGIIDRYLSHTDLNTAKSYDRFVVLTEEDKGYWGLGEHIVVIPNALSHIPTNYQPSVVQSNKILAIGRLSYQKNLGELVEIFALIHPQVPEWRLEIVGNGEEQAILEAQIARLGLNGVVTLSPATSAIEKKYANAAIYAMTSRYEGLPMVLLEAQSFGLPIVSYNCKCGPQDVIRNGQDGFVVPMGDRTQFAQCLLHLMQDSALRHRMSNQALEGAQRYSEEAIMQKWVELFHEVVAMR